MDRREIQEQMQSLDDAELRCLVTLKRDDYLPEAVDIALEEMSRRRLPVLTPEEYWQQHRDEWLGNVRFCYRCWSETTSESAGRVLSVDFVGTRLRGNRAPCEVCGSVIKELTFCFFFMPLVHMDEYRVIVYERPHYVSRKVKPSVRQPKGVTT